MWAALEALILAESSGALALVEVDRFRAMVKRRTPDEVATILARLGAHLQEREPGRSFRLADGSFAVVLPVAGDMSFWARETCDALGTVHPEVTVSIGTARTEPGLTAATVEERTDLALRAAQRRGGGAGVDYARQEEVAPDGVTAEKAQALHDLLATGYLRVNYQPIIGLRDGRIVAYEALARPQATHGLHGPLEAFDVAARLGLAAELDAVCRASIFVDGPGFDLPHNVRLHVNVHPRSLGHRSLSAAVLRHQFEEAGLSPERVVFELTGEQDDELSVTVRELDELSRLGVGLLLDDVGNGSGLRRLRTGRFTALKLSGDLLTEALDSPHARGAAEAVCTYAAATGTRVVAGGIEDDDVLGLVQGLRVARDPGWRVDAAQGFRLGRPQPRVGGPRDPDVAADEPAIVTELEPDPPPAAVEGPTAARIVVS